MHDHDPLRTLDHIADLRLGDRRDTERVQLRDLRGTRREADHGRDAGGGAAVGDAQHHAVRPDVHRDRALGHEVARSLQVEDPEHPEAGTQEDSGLRPLRRLRLETRVGAVVDRKRAVRGSKMNFRCALLPRGVEVEHEEIGPRPVPDHVAGRRLRGAVRFAGAGGRRFRMRSLLARSVHRVDRSPQRSGRSDDERERPAHGLAKLLDRVLIRRVRHRDRQLAARAEEWHRLDPAQHLLGKAAHVLRIDRLGPHVYIGNAELLRERPPDVLFGRESQLHERFTDQVPGLALPRERLLDLGFVDDSALDENRGERPRRALGPGHVVPHDGVARMFSAVRRVARHVPPGSGGVARGSTDTMTRSSGSGTRARHRDATSK